MGRRRRDDDDDDDDDFDDRPIRRPAKSGGGGKTVLIVLGIVGLVLLLVVGGCIGLGYWGFLSAKKSVNNSFSQLEAAGEANSFFAKLATDQTQAAYDSTSPAFKASISRDRLQQMINLNPVLTKNSSRRQLSSGITSGSTPNLKQTITYELSNFNEPFPQPGQPVKPPGPRTITVTITLAEQPGGFWKVENLTIP